MKYNYKLIIVLLISSLTVFNACDEVNEVPDLPFNEDLIFQNSYELDISTTSGLGNFPIFDISNVSQKELFIAVATEPLIVKNNEIENKDAIVWHWTSDMDAISQIDFSDGVVDQPSYSNGNALCCDDDVFYWAAWAWDENGRYIEASTPNVPYTVAGAVISEPEIILEDVVLTYEEGGDGFVQKGEVIRLKFFIKNIGNGEARDVVGAFSNSLVSEFPKTLNFGSLLPEEDGSAELEFRVPNITGLKLDIDIQFSYNQTLTKDTSTTLSITLLPCVTNIHLEWTAQDLDNMDTFDEKADIQLRVYANSQLIDTSPVSYNVGNNDLPIFWYYSPCGQYYLSETFNFEFKDYDDITADDYIGTMGIVFGNWAANGSFPSDTTIQNNEVRLRFEIDWK